MPKPRLSNVISHWYLYTEGFATSASDFYSAVENALTERDIPDAETSLVYWREGGPLSAKREYLRVRREDLIFDLHAAPFGTGYFFSWWLTDRPRDMLSPLILLIVLLGSVIPLAQWLFKQPGGVLNATVTLVLTCLASLYLIARVLAAHPAIGGFIDRVFRPATYYRLDTAFMFQEAVRAAVNEVINGVRSEQGLRALSDAEAAPTIERLGK